jgi:hypothetical protein
MNDDQGGGPPDELRALFPRSFEHMAMTHRSRRAAAPPAPAAAPKAPPTPVAGSGSGDTEMRALFPRSFDRMRPGGSPPAPTDATAPDGARTAPPAAPGAALDLDPPQGFKADDPVFGEFKKLAGELGLDKEKAGKLLELQKRSVEAETQVYVDELKGWEQKTRTDKEIGGTALNESLGLARGVLEKYGTPELTKELHSWGFGNHPEMIRLLSRVGRELNKKGK